LSNELLNNNTSKVFAGHINNFDSNESTCIINGAVLGRKPLKSIQNCLPSLPKDDDDQSN
jgi:hypothetical protein